jgi:hypothetical protein
MASVGDGKYLDCRAGRECRHRDAHDKAPDVRICVVAGCPNVSHEDCFAASRFEIVTDKRFYVCSAHTTRVTTNVALLGACATAYMRLYYILGSPHPNAANLKIVNETLAELAKKIAACDERRDPAPEAIVVE